MIAARRPAWNVALDRAVDRARALRKPLVVFEPLEVDYPWASDRLHCFVIQGMHDNAQAFATTPVTYFPYVEPRPGDGRGLLEAFARSACVVITDEFPCFFLPRIVATAATRLDVRLEVVDGNGLIPLSAPDRAFTTAASFRRFAQRTLPDHLNVIPRAKPLEHVTLDSLPALPRGVTERWSAASGALLGGAASCPSITTCRPWRCVAARMRLFARSKASSPTGFRCMAICTTSRKPTSRVGSRPTCTSDISLRIRCSTA
jgi:deoxyribodipyrimidine photo-lyase